MKRGPKTTITQRCATCNHHRASHHDRGCVVRGCACPSFATPPKLSDTELDERNEGAQSLMTRDESMSKASVKLTFRSEAEREWFIGQLTDGFGENECDIKWKGNMDAHLADELLVDVSRNEAFQYDQKQRRSKGRI